MTIGGDIIPDFDVARAVTAEDGGGAVRVRPWRGPGVVMGHGVYGQMATLGPALAVVADLRIDNRDDLIRELAPNEGRSVTDAMLVLHAWRRWGEDFLDHIYGPLACALWDGEQRQLVLGRDAVAMRPLHYCRSGNRWLFSATPRGLQTDPLVPRALDEMTIAAHFVQLPQEGSASYYHGISRVMPGHLAMLKGEQVRIHRHWRPEKLPRLSLPRHSDYADALRAGLEQAVRSCLPSTGLVGCELSGGLDSTAVTSLAARQLAGQGRRLVAYTGVPARALDPKLYPANIICDEGPSAALVAQRHANIEHVLIPNNAGPGLFPAMDQLSMASDEPMSLEANHNWGAGISEDAQRRRLGVLLTGTYGNITISYHGKYLLPALARQGRLAELVKQCMGMKRWDPSLPWMGILHTALGPLLPLGLVSALQRLGGKPPAGLYQWHAINRDFARKSGIDARLQAKAAERIFGFAPSGVAWRLLMMPDQGIMTISRQKYGLDIRDPTADRRLLELCLSIPEEQFLYKGEPRALIRRAMAGIVPEEILYERRKGIQSADWADRFEEARAEVVAELARIQGSPLAGRFLDLPRLQRTIEDWPVGPEIEKRNDLYGVLAQAIGVGRFLRRFEGGNQ